MDVRVLREVGLEARVAGDVREDPQLLLGVVRGQQHPARRCHERATDAAAERRTDGYVLQVGIIATKPSRYSHCL